MGEKTNEFRGKVPGVSLFYGNTEVVRITQKGLEYMGKWRRVRSSRSERCG